MREVYMLAMLNLSMSDDRYPPLTGNPCNNDLKVGDLVLIKNQTPQSPFHAKYKPNCQIIKKIGHKSFNVQDPLAKGNESLQDIYNTIHLPCRILCNSTPPKRKYSGELQNSLTTRT